MKLFAVLIFAFMAVLVNAYPSGNIGKLEDSLAASVDSSINTKSFIGDMLNTAASVLKPLGSFFNLFGDLTNFGLDAPGQVEDRRRNLRDTVGELEDAIEGLTNLRDQISSLVENSNGDLSNTDDGSEETDKTLVNNHHSHVMS